MGGDGRGVACCVVRVALLWARCLSCGLHTLDVGVCRYSHGAGIPHWTYALEVCQQAVMGVSCSVLRGVRRGPGSRCVGYTQHMGWGVPAQP